MQSAAGARLAYSPDYGAESSFPERHLDDDKATLSGIGPEGSGYHPGVTKPPLFEPTLAPLSPHGWPSQQPHFHPYNHIPVQHQLVDRTAIAVSVPQPTSSLHAEWTPFREQNPGPSPGGAYWHHGHPEFTAEDDTDSIPSHDSPEEYCPQPPTLPSQKPRRLSSHRVAKPSRAPGPIPSFQPAARSGRPYIPDFDYNVDWLDPSDASGFFNIQQPSYDSSVSKGPEIEVSYRGNPSSSKVDSKRIAHKLSEKSRRNRLTIAIREIQKLLPSEGTDEDDEAASQSRREADFIVRPGVPSSKLDIVEMAVGFIKDLKEKNAGMKRRIRELERERELCRCRGGRQGAASTREEAAG